MSGFLCVNSSIPTGESYLDGSEEDRLWLAQTPPSQLSNPDLLNLH